MVSSEENMSNTSQTNVFTRTSHLVQHTVKRMQSIETLLMSSRSLPFPHLVEHSTAQSYKGKKQQVLT